MNSIDWQTILASLCVLWAGFVLMRRALGFFRGQGGQGCGPAGCGSCASNSQSTVGEPTFVSLETFRNPQEP